MTVALLDTALPTDHPFLRSAQISQLTPEGSRWTGSEVSGHGLQVAGILAGRDPEGSFQGIVPDCRLISIPIWDVQPGGGLVPCSQARLATALRLAVELGADVINVSGGELAESDRIHPDLAAAVEDCAEHGVLVVAAAGNQGCECPHIPAILPDVLAVGAMDLSGKPVEFSNWTAGYRRNGILAPGTGIPAPLANGTVEGVSGTSFAAAVVSGVAALLLSIQAERGQAPEPLRIRDLLLETADPCERGEDNQSGRCHAGRLNFSTALERLLESPSGASIVPAAQSIDQHEEDLMSEMNAAPAPEATATAGITPAGCACGGSGNGAPQLAYAIGTIGVDFGSKLRQQSFAADMAAAGYGNNPADHHALSAFLDAQPWAAAELVWTLDVDGLPVYAVGPSGPFSAQGYEMLRSILKAQAADPQGSSARMVSVPGIIHGSATLLLGHEIPVLRPALRGVYRWSADELMSQALEGVPADQTESRRAQYRTFFDRFFYEFRNLGRTSSERATNFAATLVFRLGATFAAKIRQDLVLQRIEVTRASVSAPGGDAWDVSLYFFHPEKMLERARDVFRVTVDVSTDVPVQIGRVNSWATHSTLL